MQILAGDIGGTKTLLRVVETGPTASSAIVCEQRFDSQAYAQFDEVLADFLDQAQKNSQLLEIGAACIGVAGPVDGHQARVTNLPWRLDSHALEQAFRIGRLQLINDFQAVGYGIPELTEQDLVSLQPGKLDPLGTLAVIGAGTGLGEGLLVRDGDHYRVMPSEGGHVGFAPHGNLQRQLSAYLEQRFDYVSYELICSGPGLANIYGFMQETYPEQESEPLRYAVSQADADIAAEINRFAAEGKDKLAVACMDLFVDIYAAQAGNLALTCLPRGGVYIAGGIAPRIIPFLKSDRFLEAFRRKGKMQELMHDFPLSVVMNPEVGLLGAVAVAKRLAQ